MVVTWNPADSSISSTVVLCQSTRSVAEHNVRINGRRAVDVVQTYRADVVQNFDRANSQVSLSFEVERDTDFASSGNGASLADPEQAFVAAALHIGNSSLTGYSSVRGLGSLVMVLNGAVSGVSTLTFNNAALQSVDLHEWLGILVGFSYTFVASSITKS